MPIETTRLKLKKPLGNETVARVAINENWDLLEQNAATRQEPELLSLDVFGTTGFVKSSTDFVATKNGVTPTQLDVTAGVAWLALTGGAGLRRFAQAATNFTTVTPNTTYYLDAQPDGTYSWGTAHSAQAGYLALWEVTTDGAGQVLTVTDRRVIGKGPKAQAAGTSITDAGNHYTATDVEGALQEAGTHLTNAAPVNVLSNKTYLGDALEKNQNDRKAAQVPAITIQGSTVINLLGRDGNCEDITKWTTTGTGITAAANTTNKVFGTQSMKITASGASSTEHYADSAPITLPNTTGYYCLVGYSMAHAGRAALRVYKNSGTGNLDTGVIGVNTNSSKFVKTFAKFSTIDITAVKVRLQLLNAAGDSVYIAAGENASFDGLILLGITQAEYNDANYEPPDYVESVQFLRNPTIKSNGKNISPDITKMQLSSYATFDTRKYSDCTALKWYSAGAIAGADVLTLPRFPIKPGVTYTLSGYLEGNITGNNAYIDVLTYDETGALIDDVTQTLYTGNIALTRTSQTFTTSANAKFAEIRLAIQGSVSGTLWLSKVQLEEGAAATTFEPNRDEQIVFPVALADGEKIEYANGRAVVTENWQKDVLLDGSLNWAFDTDFAGFKRVIWVMPGDYKSASTQLSVTKYNGKVLTVGATNTAADYCSDGAAASLHITIGDTDSGWGETYAPTADEIKAYFYGWKMNNGIFGTSYNGTGTKTWIKWNAADNTGALTTVPTYLADATYTPYKLSYQLAKPRIYEIQPQGGVSLAEGVNQLEVKSGIVLGEVASPRLKSDISLYFLNYVGGDPATVNRLTYKVYKILRIYKNGKLDPDWTIRSDSVPYGKELASIPTANFDPAAIYTVDYIVLPEAHNTQVQTVTMTDNGSLRDVVNEVIQSVVEVQDAVADVYAELLRRRPDFKNMSAFRAYQTVAQSLAAATHTKIQYSSVFFDNLKEYDPVNFRFTAKKPGIYLIAAAIQWASVVDGNRNILTVYKNGISDLRLSDLSSGAATTPMSVGSCIIPLNTGDYVEIYGWTANAVVTAPSMGLHWFEVVQIA